MALVALRLSGRPGPACPNFASPKPTRVTPGRRFLEDSSSRRLTPRQSFSSDQPSAFPDPDSVAVTHLLTAYDLDTRTSVVQVTPLKLRGPGSESSLGAKLWREIRLAREVRVGGEAAICNSNELFARAPKSWGIGVVLRVGEAGIVTETVRKACAGFDLTTLSPKRLNRETAASDDELELFSKLAGEALYKHCVTISETNHAYDVSRTARGVVFVDKNNTGGARTGAGEVTNTVGNQASKNTEGNHESHLKFEVEVDARGGAGTPATLRVATSATSEVSVSVRQWLDRLGGTSSEMKRSMTNLPVVALGGPRLEGFLVLCRDGGSIPDPGEIGAPRPELNGASLLQYHRERYPARVSLLADADPTAEAVWLVPKGGEGKRHGTFGGPMAYPAELLGLKNVMSNYSYTSNTSSSTSTFSAGANTNVSKTSVVTAADTQRGVTSLRVYLGQPFVETLGLRLSDRMTRLPEPVVVSSGPCGRLVGSGSVASGPAIAPAADKQSASFPKPKLLLVRGNSSEVELKAKLIAGVSSAHEQWSVRAEATQSTTDDINNATTREFPADEQQLQSLFRRAQKEGFDLVIVECNGNDYLESLARQAAQTTRAPHPRRGVFSEDESARELSLELGALRGGQASSFPGFASSGLVNLLLDDPTPLGSAAFVGVTGISGLAYRNGQHPEQCVVGVVDSDARVRFDGTRERRAARRGEAAGGDEISGLHERTEEIDAPTDEDSVEHETAFPDTGTDYASASLTAGCVAVEKAVAVLAGGGGKPLTRLVVHHEGRSHPAFTRGVLETARSKYPQITKIDVLDVEREPGSVTGRVLRWDKHGGTRKPDKGLTWRVSPTQSVAVTTGDTNGAGQSDGYLTRPLFLNRRHGSTDPLGLAKEIVALAETRVHGFGGAHAMPVTLRGGGVLTRIVIV